MQGALRIGRLCAECHVSGAPEVAPVFGERTTRALRDHLGDTLRAALARWLDRDDESVWIVRRVDVSVLTAADAPPDALATTMATALGRTLGDALTGDGDGVNAIRFPSRAAYLARFVVDAAGGDASRRWYHASFAGLRQLSSSAAIRTALIADPARGHAALTGLDDAALARVTDALTPADERRVLDALAPADADSGNIEQAFRAVWSGCTRAVRSHESRGLALFAFIRAESVAQPSALARAARLVVDLLRAAEAAAPKPPRRLAVVGGRETVPAPLPAIPSDVPPTIVQMVLDHVGRCAEPRLADARAIRTTPFGGLLLLLRDLEVLPWDAATADWPALGGGTAAAALRWLTLGVCAGRARARRVLEDETFRTLLAIPDVAIGDVGPWLREVGGARRRRLVRIVEPPAVALAAKERASLTLPPSAGIGRAWCGTLASIGYAVLRAFARRLPGFADSSADHLRRNFLDFPATIEDDSDRVVARCGRPPLHLVLTLTGMTRGLTAGRDALGRPIVLFPQE